MANSRPQNNIQIDRDDDWKSSTNLDISEPLAFQHLLDDIARLMELVKLDLEDQFQLRMAEYENYESQRQYLDGWQLQRLQQETKSGRQLAHYFQRWAEINTIDLTSNANSREKFLTETMYILINRILLIRIAEDQHIIPRRLSNGAIQDFQQFVGDIRINYNKLLDIAYDTMRGVYEHFFKHDIFDWYLPDSELLLQILFVFNKYNFARVNRDILGNLYQKYIDKDERKRLGQFYTPDEVVQYILDAVGYTSDAEIEDKTLLDPACGSGGFLVPAVNRLVTCLKRKNYDPITILNKVRDNIYGFDINPFAVHLTEANLLFQVVDLISTARQRDPDFRMEQFNVFVSDSLKLLERHQAGEMIDLFDPTEAAVLTPHDSTLVSDIKLKRGKFQAGFDFVVGNPPYLRIQRVKPKELKASYRTKFDAAVGRFDISVLFIEQGIKWLKPAGKLGYITSNKFLYSNYGKGIRKVILQTCDIDQLIDLTDSRLFDAATLPCILVLKRLDGRPQNSFPFVALKEAKNVSLFQSVPDLFEFIAHHLQEDYVSCNIQLPKNGNHIQRFNLRMFKSQRPAHRDFWHFMPMKEKELIEKIKAESECRLVDIARIIVGIKTNADSVFTNPMTAEFISQRKLEMPLLHPVLRGKNVRRWQISWTGNVKNKDTYILYPHEKINGNVLPINLSDYPYTEKYLTEHEAVLKRRDYLLAAGRQWYEIWVHQDPEDFLTSTKIVTPDFSATNNFALDTRRFFCLGSCFVILLNDKSEDYNKFILGLLNSRLMEFFHKRNSSTFIYANRFRYWSSYMADYPIALQPDSFRESDHQIDSTMEVLKDTEIVEAQFHPIPLKISDAGLKFESQFKPRLNRKLELAKEIVILVDQILDAVKNDPLARQKVALLEAELNDKVFSLYDLGISEQDLIEEFLSSYTEFKPHSMREEM